jgi:hypothetical protein
MLAEMGQHQIMIRDYLRHANLHVTNKYLQAMTTSKRLVQGKLVDAILPGRLLSASKSPLVHSFSGPLVKPKGNTTPARSKQLIGPKRTRIVLEGLCKTFK